MAMNQEQLEKLRADVDHMSSEHTQIRKTQSEIAKSQERLEREFTTVQEAIGKSQDQLRQDFGKTQESIGELVTKIDGLRGVGDVSFEKGRPNYEEWMARQRKGRGKVDEEPAVDDEEKARSIQSVATYGIATLLAGAGLWAVPESRRSWWRFLVLAPTALSITDDVMSKRRGARSVIPGALGVAMLAANQFVRR